MPEQRPICVRDFIKENRTHSECISPRIGVTNWRTPRLDASDATAGLRSIGCARRRHFACGEPNSVWNHLDCTLQPFHFHVGQDVLADVESVVTKAGPIFGRVEIAFEICDHTGLRTISRHRILKRRSQFAHPYCQSRPFSGAAAQRGCTTTVRNSRCLNWRPRCSRPHLPTAASRRRHANIPKCPGLANQATLILVMLTTQITRLRQSD